MAIEEKELNIFPLIENEILFNNISVFRDKDFDNIKFLKSFLI